MQRTSHTVTKESAGINAATVTVCATNEEIVALGGPKEYDCPSQVRKLI